MATHCHSSILAWEIPWTEEPGGLQSTGLQRVGHDLVTKQQQQQPLCQLACKLCYTVVGVHCLCGFVASPTWVLALKQTS